MGSGLGLRLKGLPGLQLGLFELRLGLGWMPVLGLGCRRELGLWMPSLGGMNLQD